MKIELHILLGFVLLPVSLIFATSPTPSDGTAEYNLTSLPFNNDLSVDFYGVYDGSYDPASTVLPRGRSKWITSIGPETSIKPNIPIREVAMLIDDSEKIDGMLIIKHPLDVRRDFHNDPAATEYEFTITIAVKKCGMATRASFLAGSWTSSPNFLCGFRDEGGTGRMVCLAWYRMSEDKYLLAFMDRTSGPVAYVSFLNWNDGFCRSYTVKKYIDPQSKHMKVQVLINGEPQLKYPLDYASLPKDESSDHGFQLAASPAATGTFLLHHFYYTKLSGLPPSPAKEDLLAVLAIPVRDVNVSWHQLKSGIGAVFTVKQNSLTLNWQTDIAVESEALKVIPDRLYSLEGLARAFNGSAKLKISVKQFNGNYPESESPDTVKEINIGESEAGSAFAVPFYPRRTNSTVAFTIEAGDVSKALNISNLVLRGGGTYLPPSKCFQPETVTIDDDQISENLKTRTWESTEILKKNGMVGLNIAGKPWPRFFYAATYSKTGGHYGLFAEKGIHLLSTGDYFGEQFWQGSNRYDFALLERAIKRVLAVDPQARIVLGVWADPYDAWGTENPDEVCANSHGLKAIGKVYFSRWGTDPGSLRFLPSLFSAKVQKEVGKMLCRIDEWMDTNELGKSVIGYYLWGFNDADFGHWVHPGTAEGEKDPDDYSLPAQVAFRLWLQKKYHNDIEALRLAWGQVDLSFETVMIPSPERRRAKAGDLFPWLGAAEQDLIDFNQFYGAAPAAFLDMITSDLYNNMKRKKIVMMHFGNVMHGWRGYTGLATMISARGINCLIATSDYNMRWPGYPGGFDSVVDSLRLNGKAFFHEFDYRAFTAPTRFEMWDFSVGRAKNATEHEAMFLRESGNLLAHGQGLYCFDLEQPSYADAGIMNGVAKGYQLFKSQSSLSDTPEADMALFLNEDSASYLCEDSESSRFLMQLTRRHRPQWDTSGVPYHLYLQRDIANANLPKYKIYVFLMPQKIDFDELKAINALKKDGNTLVFLHAPGLLNGTSAVDSIKSMLGMDIIRLPGRQPLAGVWLKSGNPLVKNLMGRFGDRPIEWLFCDRESQGLAFGVTDKSVVPLAKYRDSNDIACAVKDFPTWRCVFMGVPRLEAQFISNLAATAGAWRAGESHDAVFANQDFITIHAISAGKKTLRSRYPSKVTDAVTGELIAENVQEFVVEMPFGQTRIFRTEMLRK